MGKSRNGRSDKEFSKEQKLIHENRVLKKALTRLRKQLERLDLDRYQDIKEIVDQSYALERAAEAAEEADALRQKHTCKECGKGLMEITIFRTFAEEKYFRQCPNCGHRTPAQNYDPLTVIGPIKDRIKKDK